MTLRTRQYDSKNYKTKGEFGGPNQPRSAVILFIRQS